MKLVPFILIIGGTSKQHKNAMESFHQNIKALGCFLGMFCVRSIKVFL